MGDIFKHFVDLIKDKTTSWGFKTALFVCIIALIFATDYYLGFSRNYHLNNKLEQIDKINKIKTTYQIDSATLFQLNKMEQIVLNQKHYSFRLSRLFLNDSINSETSEIIAQNNPANNKPTTITKKPIRSLFWMTLTSNYLFVFLFPFLLFLPLYSKNGRKGNAIVGWFASLIMIGFVITIITWISYQIPLISNNPIWNYILNFSIHTLFLILLIKLVNNDKKQKTTANSGYEQAGNYG